jgi:hypothetical protein
MKMSKTSTLSQPVEVSKEQIHSQKEIHKYTLNLGETSSLTDCVTINIKLKHSVNDIRAHRSVIYFHRYLIFSKMSILARWKTTKKVKVKLSLQQAVKAHCVVRDQGPHIF